MKESQFYGGSAQEARDGRDSFQLMNKAIEYGYTVRHEKGKVIIMPNAPPERRSMNEQPLPCGCVRGSYLCPEAVGLWNRVNAAYKRWQAKIYAHEYRAWLEYTAARARYDEHFKEQEEL